MELSNLPQGRVEQHESTSERESLGGNVTLYVRLWAYGGPSQPLAGLALEEDREVAAHLRTIVLGGQGTVVEQRPELLTAVFDNPLHALSTAKELQQRFLTFQRKAEPQQVVPSILIAGAKQQASASETSVFQVAPNDVLANGASAQILVSEKIYERVKRAPGFKFNPKPVRESGGTGGPEAIYELLWTDESTYGHLRQASGNMGFKTVGRYQIQEELGRGAMGVVYKAYDKLIGRTIALKTIEINRNAPDRDELIERLKQEAKAAGGLDHPNIITIYDVGQEDDLVYLSMQFLEGKTLLALLAEGSLPTLPVLISYAEQILSAVGFAHARGVIHRDLKPANLMLTTQGVIKVLDFGIAKVENASLTQTGLVVGTPSHMAPEQVAGKKIDHRADIFALGSVFYELVTKEKPFRGDVTTILYKIMHEEPVAPSLINPALPGGIDAIIRKALAKDPNERFQTCEEMREAFLEQGALLRSATSANAPASATVAIKPLASTTGSFPHYLLEEEAPKKPRRTWPILVALFLLSIIGVTGWAFYVKSRTGSFPVLAGRLAPLLHRAGSALPDKGKTEEQAAPQPESDQSGSISNPVNTGAANAPQPATSESVGAARVPENPTASSTATPAALPEGSISGPGDKAQPVTDVNHAVSAATTASVNAPIQPPPPATASDQGSEKSATAASGAGGLASGVAKPSSGEDSDGNASSQPAEKPVKKTPPPPPATVDGFTRRDVPELLRQADAAVGRADFRLARYEYSLILKLDPNNAGARAALRRIPATPQQKTP